MGRIVGKCTTMVFQFTVGKESASFVKKFDYAQVYHKEYGFVLCQIVELVKSIEGVTGSCIIIGARAKEGSIGFERVRSPFDIGSEVLKAEEDLISDIVLYGNKKREDLDINNSFAYTGKLQGTEIDVLLDINKMLTRHVSVLAKTGSGKSYSVGVLIEEIMEKNIPMVIIDPHGEYGTLRYPNPNLKDKIELEKLGLKPKGYGDKIIEYGDVLTNPDARQVLLNESLTVEELIEIMPTKLNNTQMAMLYSILNDLEFVNIDDIILTLNDIESSAKWSLISQLKEIKKYRIFSMNALKMQDFVSFGNTSIINLKGIPPTAQQIIVLRLLKELFEERKKGKIPPFFLVLEEAHNFIPEKGFSDTKCSGIIKTLASEGRKFGIGMCVVSQRPAMVQKTVLSQCSTQMILKVTNPNDLKAISTSVEGITAETEGEIKNLPIGTALVSGVVDMPLFVNVRPRMSMHGGESVDIVSAAARGSVASREQVRNVLENKNIYEDNNYNNTKGLNKMGKDDISDMEKELEARFHDLEDMEKPPEEEVSKTPEESPEKEETSEVSEDVPIEASPVVEESIPVQEASEVIPVQEVVIAQNESVEQSIPEEPVNEEVAAVAEEQPQGTSTPPPESSLFQTNPQGFEPKEFNSEQPAAPEENTTQAEPIAEQTTPVESDNAPTESEVNEAPVEESKSFMSQAFASVQDTVEKVEHAVEDKIEQVKEEHQAEDNARKEATDHARDDVIHAEEEIIAVEKRIEENLEEKNQVNESVPLDVQTPTEEKTYVNPAVILDPTSLGVEPTGEDIYSKPIIEEPKNNDPMILGGSSETKEESSTADSNNQYYTQQNNKPTEQNNMNNQDEEDGPSHMLRIDNDQNKEPSFLDNINEFKGQNIMSVVIPNLTDDDLKIIYGDKELIKKLVPCVMFRCMNKVKGANDLVDEYNVFVSMDNGEVITNSTEYKTKRIPDFSSFSNNEILVLKEAFHLKDFSLKDIMGKLGLDEGEIYEKPVLEVLEKLAIAGYIQKVGDDYIVTDKYILSDISSKASYDRVENMNVTFDLKVEKKFEVEKLKERISDFANVLSFRECYLVNYQPK